MTMGVEEGGACARAGATEAPQHIRWDDPGPASIVDRRAMEGHLRLSKQRSRIVEPDGRVCRRPLHTLGRSQGRVLNGRLPEQPAA